MTISKLWLPSLGAPAVALPPVSPTFWYDASQITGQADGSALASWTDLAGNGATVTQVSAPQNPTYYSTTAGKTVNGLPAVWFASASNQYLHQGAPPSAATNTMSLFAVLVGDGTSGAEGIFCNRVQGSSSNTTFSYYFNGNQWDGGSYTGPAFTTPTTAYLLSLTQQNPSLNVWKDRVAAAGNPYGSSLGVTPAQRGLGLGSSLQAGESLNGAICELLFYDSVLGTTDRQSVENYLRTKWGTP